MDAELPDPQPHPADRSTRLRSHRHQNRVTPYCPDQAFITAPGPGQLPRAQLRSPIFRSGAAPLMPGHRRGVRITVFFVALAQLFVAKFSSLELSRLVTRGYRRGLGAVSAAVI